jgi:hypothetical protein
MFVFNQETLIQILEEQPGVDVVSYGRPRDAFQLSVDIPIWTSGYGGKYEMRHEHVPAGAMIAVGNLEDVDVADQNKLKSQLEIIDIYPTGHSGDYTGISLEKLHEWFTAHNRLDNSVNNQSSLAKAKMLTPQGLGQTRYDDLVGYLADHMTLFKNPDANGIFAPADRGARVHLVEALLDGLSKTVRYTRLDDPAKAYQLMGQVLIERGDNATIHMHVAEAAKILILRQDKNGHKELTPLDHEMIGRTYATKDGQPLGERGAVDISYIVQRAQEIEQAGHPAPVLPFFRFPAPGDKTPA